MRLGLAAKLCLLAAALVFGTTMAAGGWFFRDARAAARERGLADLRDEAELLRRELLADLDRAQADLLYLISAPAVRGLLAPAGGPARPETLALQLLDARPYYRQFAVVRADAEGRELLRVERAADTAPRAARDTELRPWRDRTDFRRVSRLAPAGVWYSDVRPAGAAGDGSALEQVVAVPVTGPDGKTAAFAFLSYDFGALARRLNQSPRRLGFLVNARGDYLAHPDPAQVLNVAGVERGPLDQAFDRLHDDSRGPDGLATSVRRDELPLPQLAFFFATARFPADTPRQRLLQVRDDLRGRRPGVRVGHPDEAPGRLAFQSVHPDELQFALEDFRQALGTRVTWDEPYHCATFALRLLPLRPEARGRAGPAAEDAAPWLGLGVAVAYEEIEHAVAADYGRMVWVGLGLGAAAGAGMLLFALYLTQPLRRMTGFAERVAAGQEADLGLPQSRAKDEIGSLARAFGHMVEQVRLRTRELRESEARIRTILNTAAEGIVTIDEDGHLEAFNQAAERIFGYTAPEVRGEHFRKLLQRGAPADMPTLLNTAMASGAPGTESSLMSISRVNGTTREVLARRKGGDAFPVEMAVSEVVLGDRLVYTAILRDITERKQAEAQIQQMTEGLERRVEERTAELMQANQALEAARDLALEANRAKDAFLAVMSHELRTPLNAIIGYCDYWLHEADEHNAQEMLDDLRKMHVSGKHLLALINDILDLAKIQAGKVVLEPSDFELPPLLTELQEWVEPLVRKNTNTLTVEAGADLGAMRADRTRVRQVLLNLLSNAAKFTKSGSIRLEARRCARVLSAESKVLSENTGGTQHSALSTQHLIAAGGRDEVVFRVVDTGVGMTAEDVKRLFQPFVQVGAAGARKPEGTGLGLAICRRLCALMGGAIEVQSAPGVGTTFTVRLPARAAPPELPGTRRDQPEAPPAAADEPATVLVVDADPAVRELLERVLTKEGYRVRAAPGGAAGLVMARRERPAAVVLDALMPGGVDGWSVLTALKSDPATADIPVILATIVDGRTRGFALAASDYVTKPIDWDRLGVILRRHRSAGHPAPVLVIEDDEPTREVTARHLRAQGWEVVEAADGRQGLERLRERRPAVILLDLMMPNMDGFEFVEALRKEPAGQTIPVVVVTAADLSAADRARLSGFVQQVLQKGSVSPEQLLAEVRTRVQQCVVRRPSGPSAPSVAASDNEVL